MNDDMLQHGLGSGSGSSLTIGEMADAIVGTESTRMLLTQCEELLEQLGAVPSCLYLIDAGAMVFYPVHGFGQNADVPDIDATDILLEPSPADFLLYQRGDPVGLLRLQHPDLAPRHLVEQLSMILGPALMGVHHMKLP